jgi:hypothetical protein
VQESAISRQHRNPSSRDNSDTSHVGRVSPLVLEKEREGEGEGEGEGEKEAVLGSYQSCPHQAE